MRHVARARLLAILLALTAVGCLRVNPEEVEGANCLVLPFAQARYEARLDFDTLADALRDEDIAVARVGYHGENLSLEFGSSWPPEAQSVEGYVLVWYETTDNRSTLIDLIYRDGAERALPAPATAEILRPMLFRITGIVNATFPAQAETFDQATIDVRTVCV